jgi:PAS domain S-box-containing protein
MMTKKKYAGLNTTLIRNLKRKIKELKESEERFRTVFEGASDGILAADAKTKRFLFANPQICRITGYSQEELLRLDVNSIHPKKDLQYVTDQFTQQLQGKTTLAKDIPVLRKDKTVVFCDVNSTVIKINNQDVLLGFFRDMTESRKAEEAMKDSEEKYRTIFESATDYIFLLDTKLRFISLNPAAARRSHKTPSEMVGKSLTDMFPKDFAAEFIRNNKKVIKTGRSVLIEEERMVVNGKELYNNTVLNPIKDGNGKVIAVMGIVRDVTEKKKTEQALLESEERWRSLAQNAPNIILIVGPDDKVQFINHPAGKESVENTIGKNVYDYIPEEFHKIARKTIKNVFRTGKPGRFEGVAGPENHRSWYDTIVGPITCREKIVAVSLINTDLTESKNAELTLKERVKELTVVCRFSKLVEKKNSSLNSICSGLVDMIPDAMQYPKITCARILIDGREYKTRKFKKTGYGLSVKIGNKGVLEVYSQEKRQFLKEEIALIKVFAERLGRIAERLDAEEDILRQKKRIEKEKKELKKRSKK